MMIRRFISLWQRPATLAPFATMKANDWYKNGRKWKTAPKQEQDLPSKSEKR